MKFHEKLAWPRQQISSLSHQEKAAAARSTGLRPIHFSNRVETAARFSASLDNHYKIVIIVQDKFSGDLLQVAFKLHRRTARDSHPDHRCEWTTPMEMEL